MRGDIKDHHVAFLVPDKNRTTSTIRRLRVPGDERSRMFPGLCVSDDGRKLWVAGGSFAERTSDGVRVGTRLTNSVWCYDMTLDKWHREPDLPIPVCGCALVSKGDELYVFGGTESPTYKPHTRHSWVLDYRHEKREWRRESDLPRPCDNAVGINLGGFVALVGGDSDLFKEIHYRTSDGWETRGMISFQYGCRLALALSYFHDGIYSITTDGLYQSHRSGDWQRVGKWEMGYRTFLTCSARVTQRHTITVIVVGSDHTIDSNYIAYDINTNDGTYVSYKLSVDVPTTQAGTLMTPCVVRVG